MTPDEKRAIRLLRGCRFQPGSFAKRFVADHAASLEVCPEQPLTARQSEVLMKLLHSYRKQHGGCFCAECKAALEQQEILAL